MRLAVFQLRHERMRRVRPNLAEFALAHVPERFVPPKLIRMHRAIPTDAADADAGTVAAIHAQQAERLVGARMPLPRHAQIQIRRVAVIIHRQHLFFEAAPEHIRRQINNLIHNRPRLRQRQRLVNQLAAAPGVHEMIQADTRNLFGF